MKRSLAQNVIFWPYFMFNTVRKYLAPNLTAEDFRNQIRDPPANYVYGCHVALVTSGALGYVSYQEGIIQGHPVHRCATREALGECRRIVLRAVLSLDESTQTVFLYNKSIKHNLRVFSYVFSCPLRKCKDYVYGKWVYKVLEKWKGYYRVKKIITSFVHETVKRGKK